VTNAEDTGEVRLEIRIEALPKTVFAYLTDPEHLKNWIADLVVAEPRPGGRFRASGPLGIIDGAYVEVVPHTKVVFTWGGVEGVAPGQSTVEFTLEADGSGTIVRLRHYGLPRPTVEKHYRLWLRAGLVKIKDSAEGRRPTATCMSDATTHASLAIGESGSANGK
jgi:uncharacterized protein YndB with AHSA1/START domain